MFITIQLPANPILQNQTNIAVTKQESLFKRILIIDDHYDTTLTFKAALESCNNNNTKEFEVYTCNDPLAHCWSSSRTFTIYY